MQMSNFMIDKQIIPFIIMLFFHRYFYVRTVLTDWLTLILILFPNMNSSINKILYLIKIWRPPPPILHAFNNFYNHTFVIRHYVSFFFFNKRNVLTLLRNNVRKKKVIRTLFGKNRLRTFCPAARQVNS